LTFAAIAVALGTVANVGCYSVSFLSNVFDDVDRGGGGGGGGDAYVENGKEGTISAGLFSYHTQAIVVVDDSEVWVTNVCAFYQGLQTKDGAPFEYTIDDRTKSLQALTIAILVIGGIVCIVACCAPCFSTAFAKAWKGVGIVFLICSIMQGCTLLIMSSGICLNNPVLQLLEAEYPNFYDTIENPNDCISTFGYNMNIASVVFWFLGGVLTLALPVPSPMLDWSDDYLVEEDVPQRDDDDENNNKKASESDKVE